MSRKAAKKLIDTMLRQSGELDAVPTGIQGECTPAESGEFKTIAGNVMGPALLDAINPIVAKNPDLKPRESR